MNKLTDDVLQPFNLQEYVEILAKSVECLAEADMGSDETAESQNPQEANIKHNNLATKGSQEQKILVSDTNGQGLS